MSTNSAPVPGEVVALEASGARVRLSDGRRGRIPRPDKELRVGSRGSFTVEGGSSDGDLILASVAGPSAPHSFDREFDRLHDALANHSPQTIQPRVNDDALGERRMEQWMTRVDKAVSTLRKRRAKRLNDQA
jgi:hypothetical protein